jgi:hypothetical protein
LTRPDVAFEAAARGQKYENGIVLGQPHGETDRRGSQTSKINIARLPKSKKDARRMEGFAEDDEDRANKTNIYKPKKSQPTSRRLEAKNAIFLTKSNQAIAFGERPSYSAY